MFLKQQKFSDNQIMAITGHRSVTSLSLYEKVSTEEKLNMGRAMNNLLLNENKEMPVIESPEHAEKLSAENSMELVPVQPQQPPQVLDEFPADDDDQDIMKWLSENIENIEKQVSETTEIKSNATTTTTTTISKQEKLTQKSGGLVFPSFQNCKIGQINFHIHKH